MKKRILSFLLVLCMLVAMIPVTAAVAEEAEGANQAEPEYVSNYLDLYVTDGLVVLFDAGNLSTDMITFGETANSAGTWYGYTVDANGKLVQSDAYVANPHGGAYDADTNPFGWQKLAGGGIAWDEPESQTANYYLHFQKEWLASAFQVDMVYEPYLRDTAKGVYERVVDYDEAIDTDANYAMYPGCVEVKDSNGNTTGYMHVIRRTTTWNAVLDERTNIIVTLSGGAPDTTVKVTGNWGTAFNADTEAFTNGGSNSAITWTDAVFDEDGVAVITANARGGYFSIVVPVDADNAADIYVSHIESYKHLNQYAYGQTFVIGNLYGMVWNNVQACNTWSNGFGWARWSVAKNSWEGGTGTQANTNGAANLAQLIDVNLGGSDRRIDDKDYEKWDDVIYRLTVVNTGTHYNVYNNFTKFLSTDLDMTKANEDGTFDGQNFKMLQQMGGAVYGVRVYSAPLSTYQNNRNHFADIAQRYGLDVTKMEVAKLDSSYNRIYAAFASYALEGEDADALQAELNNLLANDPADLQTEYDKLYVQDGLIGLYSAYNSDTSVDLTKGLWMDKAGYTSGATIGGSRWAVSANGDGFGYALDVDTWTANKGTLIGTLDFDDAYFYIDNITFESVVMYVPLANTTALQYDTTLSGLRLDLVSGNTFFNFQSTVGFHFRMGLSVHPWADHNGNNASNVCTFQGAFSTYIGNGSAVTQNQILTQSLLKETSASSVHLKFTFNGVAYNTAAGSADGSISLATYNTLRDAVPRASQSGAYSMFNNMPGTVYAVRVYNRALTTTETNRNKLVDIFAYAGYDMKDVDIDSIMGNDGLLSTLLNGGIGQSADAIKAVLDLYGTVDKVTMTAYDKLYVDRGLVGLYTAYETDSANGDSSLVIAEGKVTIWIDKISQANATVSGNFVANYDGDGGFGIAPQTYDEWKAGHNFGVTFSNSYADLEDFTVENVIRYRPNSSNYSGTPASGDQQFDTTFAAMRYDVIAGLVWNTNPNTTPAYRFHVRTYLSNNAWGNSACSATRYRLDGVGSGYVGNGYNLTPNKLITHTFYKDNDGTNVYFGIYIDNAVTRNQTGFNNEGKITVAQYNTVKASSGLTSGVFSNLNGTSGTMYAVRVYNVKLTTAEVKQNKLVDLLAYANADLTNYPTEATEVAALAEAVDALGWNFDTADLKGLLERAMEVGVVTVTYKDEATGATLDSHVGFKGDYITLPSIVGGKTVVEWNVEDATEEIELTENVTYTAFTMATPYTVNGASIRVDSTVAGTGLRFTAALNIASYGDLTIKYGADNIKLGMLISTADLVASAGEFTKEALDNYAGGNAAYVDIALGGYYDITATDYIMAASLVNIKDASITNELAFAAVLYIEIDTDADGSSDTVVYGSYDAATARTVKSVADDLKAAIDADDVESGLTAEAEGYFNAWYAAKFPTAAE